MEYELSPEGVPTGDELACEGLASARYVADENGLDGRRDRFDARLAEPDAESKGY